MKRAHRAIIGAILMCGELFGEISKRKEFMRIIQSLLILAVTALNLAVVTRRIWANEFVVNVELLRCFFKERLQVAFAV